MNFAYTREGAHSRPRILYHEDITGKEISEKLLQQVLKLENVTILEYTTMQDIFVENGKCTGLKAVSAEANRARLEAMEAEEAVKTQEEIQPGGEIPVEIYAQDTILASGGIGGRYAHSTNYPHLTGDALDIAKKSQCASGTSGLCADPSDNAVFQETGPQIPDLRIGSRRRCSTL